MNFDLPPLSDSNGLSQSVFDTCILLLGTTDTAVRSALSKDTATVLIYLCAFGRIPADDEIVAECKRLVKLAFDYLEY